MSIFKACDIRGTYPDELDEATALAIGRALGARMAGRNCLLCGDVRTSTPPLKAALADGLTGVGVDVVDIGTAPTPVGYWAKDRLGTHGVVIVTASHNPPQYNGIKFKIGALPVTPEGVEAVAGLMTAGVRDAAKPGRLTRRDVRADYLSWLAERFAGSGGGRRVVVDAGNGAASHWAPEALRGAGYEVEEVFCEPDGRFPNRSPNPGTAEVVAVAAERVRATGAAFGACFDGDGDRVVFLDGDGDFVSGEESIILLLRRALSEHPGAPVVYDLKCTRVVAQEIERHGGVPMAERSGHAFIKRRLLQENAAFAGEVSGHFFFRELGGDDGTWAALAMGEWLAARGRSLAELRTTIPPWFITGDIRIPPPEGDAAGVVQRLREVFADLPQDDTDGVRIEFAGGWALCRPSVTEPVVTLRVEGESPERMEKIKATVLAAIAGVTSG